MSKYFFMPGRAAAVGSTRWRLCVYALCLVGLAASKQSAVGAGSGTLPPATTITPAPIAGNPVPGTLIPGAPVLEPGGNLARYIRVTGYGMVRDKPGEARIMFLVSTSNASPVLALQENDKQVTKVIKGLVDAGVPEMNCKFSESLLASQAHTTSKAANSGGSEGDTPVDIGDSASAAANPTDDTVPTKYTANARVQVVTSTISNAGVIVQIGMNVGASGLLGMVFEPKNVEQLKQQALISAMKDAASKAEILALGVKARVLYAISVTEIPTTAPDSIASGVAPPVELTIPMNIEVVYAIG